LNSSKTITSKKQKQAQLDSDEPFVHYLATFTHRPKETRKNESDLDTLKIKIKKKLEEHYETAGTFPVKGSIVDYWENMKANNIELYKVAKIIYSIPVTQCSVERLFSELKYILNPLRSSLESEVLDDILIIRANRNILFSG